MKVKVNYECICMGRIAANLKNLVKWVRCWIYTRPGPGQLSPTLELFLQLKQILPVSLALSTSLPSCVTTNTSKKALHFLVNMLIHVWLRIALSAWYWHHQLVFSWYRHQPE